MAGKMFLVYFSLLIAIFGVNADGELNIIYSPDSLKFTGSSKVSANVLQEIFSASLGLSTDENTDWNGLAISDPFNTPEAVVEIDIYGIKDVVDSSILKSISYPVTVETYHQDAFETLSHRIKQRYSDGTNNLIDVDLSDLDSLQLSQNLFKDITLPVNIKSVYHLKSNVEEDNIFLTEVEGLKAIAEKVKDGAVIPDNAVDVFRFQMKSFHLLVNAHGKNSVQIKEAKKILGVALESLREAFVSAYGGSVMVAVVSTDTTHSRRMKREDTTVTETNTTEAPRIDASADNYSADYAAIFNIILWFGVVFTFSLIAIVYALMDMDPGRDSIIYRMTNPKMKKDN